MLHHRDPPPKPEDPADILVGRCPSCRVVVECRRSLAQPPQSRLRDQVGGRRQAEAGGFGAWYELWSVECPACKAKTAAMMDVEGNMTQGSEGPRVYLTKKGGG